MATLRHGHTVAHDRLADQRVRVKRGNLYPEQHQIGMRALTGVTGGPSEHAGRWLECSSNAAPRGMIAGRRQSVYRIRPIGLSRFFRSNRFDRLEAIDTTGSKATPDADSHELIA